MTYAFIVEWMSSEDREAFDKELPAAPKPAGRASAPSRGTDALMAVMGMRQEP